TPAHVTTRSARKCYASSDATSTTPATASLNCSPVNLTTLSALFATFLWKSTVLSFQSPPKLLKSLVTTCSSVGPGSPNTVLSSTPTTKSSLSAPNTILSLFRSMGRTSNLRSRTNKQHNQNRPHQRFTVPRHQQHLHTHLQRPLLPSPLLPKTKSPLFPTTFGLASAWVRSTQTQ